MDFMTTQNIELSEAAAGEVLGLREAEVKRLRRVLLEEGAGFSRVGRGIKITQEGLRIIADSVAAGAAEKKRAEVSAVVVDVGPVVFRDLVVDATVTNPKLVLAHYMSEGKPVRVRCRVRSAVNFTRGMALQGCREVSASLFAYEGRLPRFRGDRFAGGVK
jgi:hypothetical protein